MSGESGNVLEGCFPFLPKDEGNCYRGCHVRVIIIFDNSNHLSIISFINCLSHCQEDLTQFDWF